MPDLDAIATALAARFGLVTSPSGADYRTTVLATNPVAYWRLGEASGTVAVDEMGGHDGAYINAPTLGVTGLLARDTDTAATFNGVDESMIAPVVVTGADNWTLAAWVTIPAPVDYMPVIWNGDLGSGYGLYLMANRTMFGWSASGGALTGGAGSALPVGTSFVVLVRRAGRAYIYANGVLDETGNTVAPSVPAGDTLVAAHGAFMFAGTVDEPAIWNRALTAAEVLALYEAGTQEYRGLRLSTADLPNQLPPTPCVLVFPDEGRYETGNGTRQGVHRFIVRFYYDQTGDLTRAMVALRRWQDVLCRQLLGSVQLGGIVTRATVDEYKLGSLSYAGEDYEGIELRVTVVTDEGWAAVA